MCQPIFAQVYNPNHPPNTYNAATNPHYWKNKKPYDGYWQQDVHYTINAKIDERTDILSAAQNLVYTNNSPHTLNHVFFHLYQNAFQPDSYYDEFQKAQGIKTSYGIYESQKLGTTVSDINIVGSSGITHTRINTELDNTILKIELPEPLLPNEQISINMNFKTYFDAGSVRRRMKVFNAYDPNEPRGKTSPNYKRQDAANKHYDGVHWYPRICVFDKKFGWTTDQHLGREFYGDFGTYDVVLDFSSNMVLEATGYLQNKAEVLPPELEEKLNVANFAKKPWNEKPSIITPYRSSERKSWYFHAENVHDFAFTADPTYRIDRSQWNGIETVGLAREHHAARWQTSADYAAKIIELFSNDFGEYIYNKIIVADARDGMEYPMITLDRGGDPGYRGLLNHEIGHMWFFGMVGNNETYSAALDEGFTQYLTVYGMEKLEGEVIPVRGSKKYQKKFRDTQKQIDRSAYHSYLSDAKRGKDPILDTHSNHFEQPTRGYRHVYSKTATMLFNLEYVLGEDMFKGAIKHYVNKWRNAHPYFEDFRDAVTEYTGADLNWFFDQWIESNKNIDYAIKNVKNRGDGYTDITIKRKGDMQMPLDVKVVKRGGRTQDYHIPNTWFVKKTDAEVLPKWTSFNFLNKTYTATVPSNGGVVDVILDPKNKMADINLLNNRLKNKIDVEFDHQLWEPSNRYKYDLKWRPALWYNAYDGAKLGAHFRGDYYNYKHKFDAAFFVNTRLAQFDLFDHNEVEQEIDENDLLSFWLNYKTNTDKFIPLSDMFVGLKHIDGYEEYKLGLESTFSRKHKVQIQFKAMHRSKVSDMNYLIYPQFWADAGTWNNVFDLTYTYPYKYHFGDGNITARLRTPAPFSNFSVTNLRLTVINDNHVNKLDIKTRVFAQIGTGVGPKQSNVYLAGASPEQMMDNKYVRSLGFFPKEWANFGSNTNHFHHGGMLNLRGYSNYYAPEITEEDEYVFLHRGSSGASVNVEVEFDKLFSNINLPRKLKRVLQLDTYLFADVGSIGIGSANSKSFYLSKLRLDFGIGSALTIKKFWLFETTKPLTLRFDMPLFLSSTPFDDPEHFQFRWLFGIGRAF